MRPFVFVGIGLCAGLVASTAAAAPTGFAGGIDIETIDVDSNSLDLLSLMFNAPVGLGQTVMLDPIDSNFAPSVEVTFESITAGNQRTVIITYQSMDSYFVLPEAFDSITPPPEEGLFGIYFDTYFTDAEWAGGMVSHSQKLFDDGQEIFSGVFASTTLGYGAFGFADFVSPADSGFFGAPGPVDRFVLTVSYTIVPTPGVMAGFMAAGCLALRRRRGA